MPNGPSVRGAPAPGPTGRAGTPTLSVSAPNHAPQPHERRCWATPGRGSVECRHGVAGRRQAPRRVTTAPARPVIVGAWAEAAALEKRTMSWRFTVSEVRARAEAG
jgi:hypothetical protein